MKKTLHFTIFLLLAISLIACNNGKSSNTANDDVKPKRSFSMYDSVVYDNKIVTISSAIKILSKKLTDVCIKSKADKNVCQCGIDNFFKYMSADEFMELLDKGESILKNEEFISMFNYCLNTETTSNKK